MNKRSNMLDVGLMLIFLFGAVVVFILGNYTITTFTEKWQNNSMVNSSQASVTALQDVQNLADTRFDYMGFMVLIGMTLAIIITGWFVGGNPIFSFIYFIVLVIFTVLAAIFSFTYNKIAETTVLQDAVSHLPIMDFLMSNLPVYTAIVGFIGMVVMFAKPQQ